MISHDALMQRISRVHDAYAPTRVMPWTPGTRSAPPLNLREVPKYTCLDTASLAMTSDLRIIAITLDVGSRGGEKCAVAASGGCTLAGSTEVKSAVESMRTESLS